MVTPGSPHGRDAVSGRGEGLERLLRSPHGRYRVADAIFRLRTTDRHLVPEGMEIVTFRKEDSNGNSYGEWSLQHKAAA